jgi:hypothetical protein
MNVWLSILWEWCVRASADLKDFEKPPRQTRTPSEEEERRKRGASGCFIVSICCFCGLSAPRESLADHSYQRQIISAQACLFSYADILRRVDFIRSKTYGGIEVESQSLFQFHHPVFWWDEDEQVSIGETYMTVNN